MRGKQWQHQGAIFAVLTLLSGIISPFLVTNIKTLAQTPSTQTQCTEVEIKNYIQKLSDSQPSIYNALVACNSQAVPELIKALKNQKKQVRIMAITALGEIASPSAVPSLSNLLSTETLWDVRVAIIFALSQFGQQGVPRLVNALTDKDWYIRYQAANVLDEISSTPKDAVPTLTEQSRTSVRTINEQLGTSHVRTVIIRKVGSHHVASSISPTKPPLMCRVPTLRTIFKWKCSG
jgi:HEAT repeats